MLGVVLAAYSSVTQIRDVGLATGATGPDQRAFFIAAADRPDIAVFFKGLKPQERLKMARQLGEYDDPKIAVVIAKLLGDFDVEARKVLTASLTRLARTQPAAVAEQLKEKGSFQQYGVSEALRSQGESVLPAVVTTLANGDARPNAVAYLVAAGPPAIPLLVPKLDDANKDVVLAAADALGKLRARAASPRLVALYRAALPDDRTSYLTALAGLGDPATEPIFQSIAQSDREPNPIRAQAALGLGRIGSTT
ncbi:MAG: hypothetical protein SFX74_09090, partial [Fimbriimonadaceae bacterium]|nr:hypothetical protein [Fimbriimonadaceae bacterium]